MYINDLAVGYVHIKSLFLRACFCLRTRFCLLVPVQIDMSPGSHVAGRFLLVKWKAHNRFRLHARVSNLLANQQAFSHEQASARMQIFCSLKTLKDQYGGKLHVRIRAYKRLCNVNAAVGLKCNVKLYADDTSLFTVVEDSNTAANDMNHDLDLISQWAYAWRMSFNPDPQKQAVELTFSRKKTEIDHPAIFLTMYL